MNIKKAQWLKRPASFSSISLHSLSYQIEGKTSVFFTIGENDRLTLSYSVSENVDAYFVFFHTPSDYINIKRDKIEFSFFSLKGEHNMYKPLTEIEINKNGEEIEFLSSSTTLFKIKNPAFFSSASFGIKAEGSGAVNISVW